MVSVSVVAISCGGVVVEMLVNSAPLTTIDIGEVEAAHLRR